MTFKPNSQLPFFSDLPFTDGCSNHWFAKSSGNTDTLAPVLTSWLFDNGSLTQRLQTHCKHFEVIVLREGLANIAPLEQPLFNRAVGINSREVLLVCDGQPQVYARTLIPQGTLAYANRLLTSLGNTSLGEVLFRAENMQRQQIQTTSFTHDSDMTRFATALTTQPTHTLWARRSIFTLDDNPLMVSEVFLPGSYAYLEASST